MKRRTMLRRIGATGIATTAVAAASTSNAAADEECCQICCKNPNVWDPRCPCYECNDDICM